jgi:GNAT superfamily N-acetyltransferase
MILDPNSRRATARSRSEVAPDFRPARSDASPGRELLAELIEHFNAIYPGRAARPGSVTTPDELVAPAGTFLVGWDGDRAIACGGLRRLEDGICEIKRMYVVPAARSHGVGRALLAALEDAAREFGYERVRLDAGPEQRHSKALFAASGYAEIAPYNANHIADYWAEKRL